MLNNRRIRVTKQANLPGALIGTGFPNDFNNFILGLAINFGNEIMLLFVINLDLADMF
jgi:hypothetical protein